MSLRFLFFSIHFCFTSTHSCPLYFLLWPHYSACFCPKSTFTYLKYKYVPDLSTSSCPKTYLHIWFLVLFLHSSIAVYFEYLSSFPFIPPTLSYIIHFTFSIFVTFDITIFVDPVFTSSCPVPDLIYFYTIYTILYSHVPVSYHFIYPFLLPTILWRNHILTASIHNCTHSVINLHSWSYMRISMWTKLKIANLAFSPTSPLFYTSGHFILAFICTVLLIFLIVIFHSLVLFFHILIDPHSLSYYNFSYCHFLLLLHNILSQPSLAFITFFYLLLYFPP